MDDKMKYQAIQEIMDDLQAEMEMGPEDFDERLGRKKPDVAAIEIKTAGDVPVDADKGMPMGEMDFDEEPSEDDELKARIMKMRG